MLQIVIGAGLITSGILHQKGMQIFELRIYELLSLDWTTIPVFGRIWSALEIYLGVGLILRINPKKIHTYLLMVVSAFVLYDAIWDTFFSANKQYLLIWPIYTYFGPTFIYYKLLLALFLASYTLLDFKFGTSTDLKWKWIKFLFPVGALAFTFIYNAFLPADLTEKEPEMLTEVTVPEMNENIEEGDKMIRTEGDQILMFISLGCSHCFESTKKIAAIQRNNPDLAVRLILFDEKNYEVFTDYAHAEDMPYSKIAPSTFIDVTGGSVPRIIHVRDGEVIKQWDGRTFNYYALSYLQHLK